MCPCVSVHACTSAPSGEIGPRAAGYHPMHRALINWLRSGPEWAVNICLWRITHPSSLMCVKTGFSVGSDTRSPCWIYNLGYTRSDLTSLFSIKLLSIDFKLYQISWTSYGYFGRRKDPQCRKQKGNWSNIIRDKVAASILLKTKSAVNLCYEKLFGEITSCWFSGSPLF